MSDININEEFDEVFSLFQYEENKVKKSEISSILRLVGLFPSNKEIEEYIKTLDPKNERDFLERSIVKESLKNVQFLCKSPIDIRGMLSFLIKDDKVSLKDLIVALTSIGEPLNRNDLNELFKSLNEQYGDLVPVSQLIEVFKFQDYI